MPVAIIYNNDQQRGDLVRNGVNLVIDDGLESAVHISLLTNRRADEGDPLPAGADPQGWCLDYMDDKGRKIGSKLWLLTGQALSPPKIQLAGQYAKESLAWMVEDGVADQIKATPQRIAHGIVGISVEIHKPGDPADRWRSFWVAVDLATLTEF